MSDLGEKKYFPQNHACLLSAVSERDASCYATLPNQATSRYRFWLVSAHCNRMATAVRTKADLILIQELREEKEKDSTRSHPSFRFIRGEEGVPAKCWVAVNRASRCQVTELKDLTRGWANYAQALEVKPPGGPSIVIVNIYDRGTEGQRLAQAVQWDNVMRHSRVIVAGDMNAHSLMWNPKARSRRNAAFWENLITEHALVVWNSEEATRMGAGASNHSIIDLTLTSRSLELNWRIAEEEEATGSDHEVIVFPAMIYIGRMRV